MSSETYDRILGLGDYPNGGGMFAGVAVGIVTNVKDPEGLGRVKLKLPWLDEESETDWARVAVPLAGKDRGAMFQPAVDDEALVAFEHGDPGTPYVLGFLWNGKDTPPDKNPKGKSDVVVIKSRSGHILRLDDTDGAEKLEILDKSGKTSVVMDVKAKKLTITAEQDLLIEAGGKLTLKAKGGVEVLSDGAVDVQAKNKLTAKGSQAEVNGSSGLVLKGATVNIN